MMGKPVLLVVDMQRGLFDGEPSRYDAEGVIARINALSELVRVRGGKVVFIRHTDAADGLAAESDAWQVLPALNQSGADIYVEKTACDAFLGTPLKAVLDAAAPTQLIVCGCATDFCVDTTVRAAASLGYPVSVASDAHTTRDRPHLAAATIVHHHNYMWQNLIVPGNPVRVATTAALCASLSCRS